MLLERQRFGDLVVKHHGRAEDLGIVGPEVGDLGLVGRASRAFRGSQRHDFVVGRCVLGAVQGRRRGGWKSLALGIAKGVT